MTSSFGTKILSVPVCVGNLSACRKCSRAEERSLSSWGASLKNSSLTKEVLDPKSSCAGEVP